MGEDVFNIPPGEEVIYAVAHQYNDIAPAQGHRPVDEFYILKTVLSHIVVQAVGLQQNQGVLTGESADAELFLRQYVQRVAGGHGNQVTVAVDADFHIPNHRIVQPAVPDHGRAYTGGAPALVVQDPQNRTVGGSKGLAEVVLRIIESVIVLEQVQECFHSRPAGDPAAIFLPHTVGQDGQQPGVGVERTYLVLLHLAASNRHGGADIRPAGYPGRFQNDEPDQQQDHR